VRFLRSLLRRDRLEADMADEMAFHIEARADALAAGGLTREEARRRARLEFGAPDRYKEECRESLGLRLADELRADLRVAFRQLARARAFSLATIAIVAVAIGASTALFSTADAVLLRLLPVDRPQELRRLAWVDGEGSGFMGSYEGSMHAWPNGRLATSFAYPVYRHLRDHGASFSELVSFGGPSQLNLTIGGHARLARGQLVSGNFLRALGTEALLGRVLLPEDDGRDALGYAAVLGHGFWQRELGADPGVLGRTLLVNGTAAVVVGVLPRGACGVDPSWCPDLMLPMAMQAVVDAGPDVLENPRRWGFQVIGRLKPGVADESARAETEHLVAEAIRADEPSEAWEPPHVVLMPGGQGLQDLRSDLRTPLLVLAGAVAAVVLVACANVAGLLLARASDRRHEIASRLALGASRARVMRQLLTESLLLAALGGGLGVLLAYGVGDGISRSFLGSDRPLGVEIALGGRVLAFAVVLLGLVGLAFGTLPALRATRLDLVSSLRATGTAERTSLRAGKLLIGVQVALSLALVAGSLLFVRTLVNLRAQSLGFRPENLLVFQLDPTLNGYRDARLLDFHERVLAGVERLPGVRSASMSRWGLLAGSRTRDGLRVPGGPDTGCDVHYVAPRFFETLGFPLVAGRDFTPADREGGQPVVIVNESLARKLFPDRSPLGQTVVAEDAPPMQVVGVVGDTKFDSIREPMRPTVYYPFRQQRQRSMTYALRSELALQALLPGVERAVREVDPNVPLFELATQQQRLSEVMRNERLFALLVSSFAALALGLAGVGVYGTLAYQVSRRTPEIGLRMALGARAGHVVRLVAREAALPIGLGVVAGLAASFAAGRLVESQLFGTSPRDPLAFAGAGLALALSAALAAALPAWRATRIAPMRALRQD
jgi:predicted permease